MKAKEAEAFVEKASRADLIRQASEMGFDGATKAKSDDLKEFIVDSAKAGKPTRKESPALTAARDAYAQARERIRAAIETSQKAMKAYRANPNDTTKAAYKKAQEDHKASIAHIKDVRTKFQNLRKAEDEREEATA